MLVNESLGLLIIKVDGETVIVVPAKRVLRVSVLPVHVGDLLLDGNLLPSTDNFEPSLVTGLAQGFLASLGSHPPVLLVNHWLASLPCGLSVVVDPLIGPLDGLAPPVGVGVEDAKVDIFEADLMVEVTTVGTIVGPVVGLDIESTFSTPGDKMVGVDALDIGAYFVDPSRHKFHGAIFAAGEVAGTISAAAGFVGKLPSHDGGRVLIAGDELLNVGLEVILDHGQAVELEVNALGSAARFIHYSRASHTSS